LYVDESESSSLLKEEEGRGMGLSSAEFSSQYFQNVLTTRSVVAADKSTWSGLERGSSRNRGGNREMNK
jgi:hypothetical protein